MSVRASAIRNAIDSAVHALHCGATYRVDCERECAGTLRADELEAATQAVAKLLKREAGESKETVAGLKAELARTLRSLGDELTREAVGSEYPRWIAKRIAELERSTP